MGGVACRTRECATLCKAPAPRERGTLKAGHIVLKMRGTGLQSIGGAMALTAKLVDISGGCILQPVDRCADLLYGHTTTFRFLYVRPARSVTTFAADTQRRPLDIHAPV